MIKILMVIAPQGFRDEELFIPKEIFEEAGHEVDVVSTKIGISEGMYGGSIKVDSPLKDINSENYNAVVFVGGGGAKVLFDDPQALRVAKEMNNEGKVIGAICIAPVILANAGLLKGKNATVFDSEIDSIKSQGAKYSHEGVTVDGKIVTGAGPQYAELFAEKILKLIK